MSDESRLQLENLTSIVEASFRMSGILDLKHDILRKKPRPDATEPKTQFISEKQARYASNEASI